MYYDSVLAKLLEHNVRFAVVGGVAVVLHGVMRYTADLDIVVHLTEENLGRLVVAMKELDYRPRLPVDPIQLLDPVARRDWTQNRNLKAFTFWNPDREYREVDILLSESEVTKLIDDAIVIEAGGLSIPVVNLDELIEMKLRAGRQRDRQDVAALREVREITRIEYGKR